VKKRKEKLGELVTLVLVFPCPNGHEVTLQHLHFQSLDGMRKLEATEFAVHCPICKWEGMMKGSQRISLRQAE
jgi:hypothetical protein